MLTVLSGSWLSETYKKEIVSDTISGFGLTWETMSRTRSNCFGPTCPQRLSVRPHACTSLVRHDGSLGEFPNWELYRSAQFSIEEKLLRRNLKRFRGGLVSKVHRLLHHSVCSRVMKKQQHTQISTWINREAFVCRRLTEPGWRTENLRTRPWVDQTRVRLDQPALRSTISFQLIFELSNASNFEGWRCTETDPTSNPLTYESCRTMVSI